jgi:hypothetical protein
MTALHPTLTGAIFGPIPHVRPPTLAAGKDSQLITKSLAAMERPSPSATNAAQPARLPERLFNVSAALKILVSQISMHLPDDWRRRLFQKIDHLHDPDNWEPSDAMMQQDSFMSFLGLVLQIGPINRMSLGVSDNGHLLAGWIENEDSLTLEFAGPDEIRWAVVRHADSHRESAAGRTSRARLADVLRPYAPETWFGNANAIPARP